MTSCGTSMVTAMATTRQVKGTGKKTVGGTVGECLTPSGNGDSVGAETVGMDVVGDTDGEEEVGDTDGDGDGTEMEGDTEGDMVGEVDGETVDDVVGNIDGDNDYDDVADEVDGEKNSRWHGW